MAIIMTKIIIITAVIRKIIIRIMMKMRTKISNCMKSKIKIYFYFASYTLFVILALYEFFSFFLIFFVILCFGHLLYMIFAFK